jgi:membrane protease YdiL (CAAX protease family)
VGEMSKDSFENNGKKIKEIDQEKKNILFGGSFENNGENIKEIEEEKKGILFGDSVESISNEKWGVGIKKLLSGQDKNAALSVLFATIVLLLYFYFGIQDFFAKSFPYVENIDYWKYIYHNFIPLFLFFIMGIIFVKFVLKARLKDFGLGLGDRKAGLKLLIFGAPLLVLAGLTTVWDSGMNQMYPLAREVIYAPIGFVFLYYISYIAYYIGWEFLFRGLLVFSLEKRGPLLAIMVSTMISALIHSSIAGFGKPFAETASAIIAGIAFGYTAYKTRSVWYSFVMHAIVGFSTDLFISIFTRSGLI